MVNILIFYQIYFNLSENCRNRILRNIFGITDVSIFEVFIRDEKLVFRLFDNNVFYQYVFIWGSGENLILKSDYIVNMRIFICNDGEKNLEGNLNELVSLLRCQDEYCVYKKFKYFL